MGLFQAHGFDLDRLDRNGNTALLRSESDAFSTAMLEAGAIVCGAHANFHNKSALVSSAKKGHLNAIRYMVQERGVGIDQFHGRGTTVHCVLYSPFFRDGDAVVGLRALVGHGADLNMRDFMGRTPIFLVYESVEGGRILLDGGATLPLKSPGGGGSTAGSLMYAETIVMVKD